jgi:hypothetical protein
MTEPEYRNVTEEIDACIREHGGNTRDARLGAAVRQALRAIANDGPSLWLEIAIQKQKRLKQTYVGMLLSAIATALDAEGAGNG